MSDFLNRCHKCHKIGCFDWLTYRLIWVTNRAVLINDRVLWFIFDCVTQLKLYTGDKLSSTIFCCLWGIGNTQPNLHFFQYIQAYKHFADLVPPNIKQYQLILTKYQPLSSYTDPVQLSTTRNSSSWRHSSANWIISFFTTHLMSHAQYTWSSFELYVPKNLMVHSWTEIWTNCWKICITYFHIIHT